MVSVVVRDASWSGWLGSSCLHLLDEVLTSSRSILKLLFDLEKTSLFLFIWLKFKVFESLLNFLVVLLGFFKSCLCHLWLTRHLLLELASQIVPFLPLLFFLGLHSSESTLVVSLGFLLSLEKILKSSLLSSLFLIQSDNYFFFQGSLDGWFLFTNHRNSIVGFASTIDNSSELDRAVGLSGLKLLADHLDHFLTLSSFNGSTALLDHLDLINLLLALRNLTHDSKSFSLSGSLQFFVDLFQGQLFL